MNGRFTVFFEGEDGTFYKSTSSQLVKLIDKLEKDGQYTLLFGDPQTFTKNVNGVDKTITYVTVEVAVP